ncbi:hypothetical protein CAOG_06209 [Capsaspora owczarzaki ATCC 30864]|uniref:Complex III subunit 9 n=1 Tax=Capsaspora owczarzaki (strain ATCC 30864) TaxID=595528 RepID=A0A0D2X4C0_CAPO3|nr:hypothetical protein CAOG_06209 [Capsaspora owczarzaki ATCC 30864]KJE95794.1 hypothetical protein CAOG_006209 [Capsaspora owczarzaki ATCC 30864]|eukprot:XP_004345799.1 hypothetical protein CAOG_06209 [Capsaspora owczarzaki ATCC 30864]
MSLGSSIYQLAFKRNSVYITGIITGAFIFEKVFDSSMDGLFAKLNEGKSFEDLKKARNLQ